MFVNVTIIFVDCGIKSTCLHYEQALHLAREIQRLSIHVHNVNLLENDGQQSALQVDPAGITLGDPISEVESPHISASVTRGSLLDITQTR